MVFKDLYKKTRFLKMTCFFFQKNLAQKHVFMIDKTKQKLLFENYECISKKEKRCQEPIFSENTYLGPQWVQVQPVRVWF